MRITDRTLDRLRPYARDYLSQYMGRNPEKAFTCVNPQHEDKHPSGYYGSKGNVVSCSSCGCKYSLFDLIGLNEGISNFQDQVQRAAQLFGVEIEYTEGQGPRRSTAREDFEPLTGGQNHIKSERKEEPDFSTFFSEAHKHLSETDYPRRRGLGAAVCDAFNLGYVAAWKHPDYESDPRITASPRLIVPTSAHSYLARDTRPDAAPKSRKLKAGKVHIFNLGALTNEERPVFVAEGEIDALSIIEAGGEALGLGSTAYVKIFLRELDALLSSGAKITRPLILTLDNDPAGEKAMRELEDALKQRSLFSYRRSISGSHKDANEALVADREALEAEIRAAEAEATAAAEEARAEENAEAEAEKAAFLGSISIDLSLFEQGIKDSVNTPCMSTGFEKLDAKLGGGLYPGLIILGGVTSAGKTAIVSQIGDQVAAAGNHVITVSLEMAASELVSRSISRHTLLHALAHGIDTANCKSARGITDGNRWSNYSATERTLIYDAIDDFSEYSDRIKIKEGLGDIGALEIRELVERYISYTGVRPLLIVDYLQVLASPDPRLSDKQCVDRNVVELKRISRDFGIPVFVIASLNRAGYKQSVRLEDFKESGSIEYSADLLLGYQFAGADKQDFDLKQAKAATPREMELTVLKNRAGAIPNEPARFRYYSAFNCFFEE